MRVPAVVASSAAGVAFGANFTNLGAIAEDVAASYGVALATVGLLTTVLVATHIATQIPGGKLVDRLGARGLTLASVALVAACNVVLLVAPDPALAFALRTVVGIGTGVGFVAATDFIRSSGGTAIAQGLYGGIGYGSTAIPLLVVPQLEALVGWRAPYVTALGIAGGALVLIALAEREQPRARASLHEPESLRPGLFTDVRLYRLAAMHGIALLGLVVGNWISTLYVRAFDLGIGTAGLLGGVALLGGLVTRPATGWIVHHRPELVRRTLVACLLGGAAGTLLLATAPSIEVAVLGSTLLGFAAGVPFAAAMFGAGRVRPEAPGAAVGLVNTVGNLSVMVGTPLLGLAFSLPGDGRIGFGAVAVVWLLGLFLLPRAHELGVMPSRQPRPPVPAASLGD